MIINGQALWEAAPIKDMLANKEKLHGVSFGLSEVGYDLRVKQRITFDPPDPARAAWIIQKDTEHSPYLPFAMLGRTIVTDPVTGERTVSVGRCAMASSLEEFQIPDNLWCEFRNKSTWARRFVDATLGTDGEPGWSGFLTIEMVFHGQSPITIHEGSGLLKAVFHQITEPARYEGKYQGQADMPVPAILEV